jgi:hypothetical protein
MATAKCLSYQAGNFERVAGAARARQTMRPLTERFLLSVNRQDSISLIPEDSARHAAGSMENDLDLSKAQGLSHPNLVREPSDGGADVST